MRIYLAQHGAATDSDTDPERPLTGEGRLQAERGAAALNEAGVSVARICHSGKLRARQTAEIFGAAIGVTEIDELEGMAPNDDPATFADALSDEDVLYVGHLPHLQCVASYLVAGDPELGVIRFHNGGVVCIEKEENSAQILWATL